MPISFQPDALLSVELIRPVKTSTKPIDGALTPGALRSSPAHDFFSFWVCPAVFNNPRLMD